MFKETTKEEYFNIYKEHNTDLCVHASYTDVTGDSYEWSTGDPQCMTEWGLKNSETPMIKAESETIDGETTHKYFLYCV